jgi:hypothetical protein
MIQEFEKFTRKEEIPKKYLKELYEDSKKNLHAYLEELKKVNKNIKNDPTTEDPELAHLIELLHKVKDYEEYQKNKLARDNILLFVDGYRKQKDDILKVCPEFER